MAKRPALRPIGPDMQRWCALLEDEVAQWPHVTSRPMFGMTAMYRGRQIFAAIPRTRAAENGTAILIKLPGVQHAQLGRSIGPGAGWTTYVMESEDAVATALRWLERAYRKAK